MQHDIFLLSVFFYFWRYNYPAKRKVQNYVVLAPVFNSFVSDSQRLVEYRTHIVTDGRQLEVRGVTHSELEVNLTISWEHLNLSCKPHLKDSLSLAT